ncbi:MAG: hypothetical protein NZ605_12890, partial [Acidimicrobiales bacterium]|nr:hypothetical protein [Acidimicrobiales bacterium]
GLSIDAEVDPVTYEKGIKISDSHMRSLTRIIHQCWATSRKSFSSREVQRSYLEHRAEAGNY